MTVEDKIPDLLAKLENDFRGLLGTNDSSA